MSYKYGAVSDGILFLKLHLKSQTGKACGRIEIESFELLAPHDEVARDAETVCFLCNPNPEWVWLKNEHFFVIMALGPVVKGMSIVASTEHTRSMFDVNPTLLPSLLNLTNQAIAHLEEMYKLPVHVTEHGRVGLCEIIGRSYDPHCIHAHRLLFPANVDLKTQLSNSDIEPIVVSDFNEAKARAGHLIEYLYYESPAGEISVGAMTEAVPRQFFRSAVAHEIGRPELTSWRTTTGSESLASEAKKLRTL